MDNFFFQKMTTFFELCKNQIFAHKRQQLFLTYMLEQGKQTFSDNIDSNHNKNLFRLLYQGRLQKSYIVLSHVFKLLVCGKTHFMTSFLPTGRSRSEASSGDQPSGSTNCTVERFLFNNPFISKVYHVGCTYTTYRISQVTNVLGLHGELPGKYAR